MEILRRVKAIKWREHKTQIVFGLIFLAYFLISWTRLHADFGWHLMTGEYILSHGVPTHDIFTYTASDFPWVNHEWLSDVALSIFYNLGGYNLLCLLYAGFWTLAIWLVGRKANLFMVAAAAAAIAPYSGVRAIAFSALGFATIYTMFNSKNRKIKLFIPLLFLAWANIHGSFVIGLVYLAYQAFMHRSRNLWLLAAASALMTLFNPYGLEVYTEVFRTMLDPALKHRVPEWKSFSFPLMTLPFIGLWLIGFIGTGIKNWRKYLGFDVILLLMGLNSTRNLVLFVLGALMVTDERVMAVWKANIHKFGRRQRRTLTRFLVILAITAAVLIAADLRRVNWDREYYYPTNAVAYLQKHPCAGNLFNHYDYGGYLIWKLPGKKVYIDGRMPSWSYNGRNYMNDYYKVFDDKTERDLQFLVYDVRCALLMKDDATTTIVADLSKEGWVTVATDHNSVLLVR